MFCENCGSQLNEGAAFCPRCGAQTGAVQTNRIQRVYENGVNQTKPKKRKSPLVIGIGAILYAAATVLCSSRLSYLVLFLFGLVELICAIANKKAAFVLSVIQTVVFIFAFNLSLAIPFLSKFIKTEYILLVLVIDIDLPIAACILLLLGGIMFRKEHIKNSVERGRQ